MKKAGIYFTILALIFLFASCSRNGMFTIDTQPPAPPTGVYVVNGDNEVDIYWNDSKSSDVAGYNVYYGYSYNGKYTLLGSTTNNYFVDNGAQDGTTYYYAVTAYDYNGNESQLSYDNVNATPRPQGANEVVFDYRNYPNISGFSFTTYTVVPYDDQSADFFFENYNGTLYVDVWNDTNIQDMGPTNSIYDIPYAPSSGWSPTKDAIAYVGHTYVIWTWDNYYAKIRIKSLTSEKMIFDWAFQTVKGNTQLKIKVAPAKRMPIDKNLLRRK